jgi:putative transport protein
VLLPPEKKEEVRRYFGDTVKAAAEFSYVSLGIGMVLGVLLGLIPIPIPGVGTVTLGIGGGPLIVALILGKLRQTGPMIWVMATARQYRAPQFWPGDVSRRRRNQCGDAVCAHDL